MSHHHGRDDDVACCYVRLENPETRSSSLRFPSSAGYSDGKQSTNMMSFVGKDGATNYTNLFTPVLHTFLTFNLTLLPMKEE
jgi:hypothetical protein